MGSAFSFALFHIMMYSYRRLKCSLKDIVGLAAPNEQHNELPNELHT